MCDCAATVHPGIRCGGEGCHCHPTDHPHFHDMRVAVSAAERVDMTINIHGVSAQETRDVIINMLNSMPACKAFNFDIVQSRYEE